MECNEEFVGESCGRINKEEAALSISQLTNYINKIGKDRFLEERIYVGLISPYKAQVQYPVSYTHPRMFIMLFPSNSMIFILVCCSNGVLSLINSQKDANSSLSGK